MLILLSPFLEFAFLLNLVHNFRFYSLPNINIIVIRVLINILYINTQFSLMAAMYFQ